MRFFACIDFEDIVCQSKIWTAMGRDVQKSSLQPLRHAINAIDEQPNNRLDHEVKRFTRIRKAKSANVWVFFVCESVYLRDNYI